MTTLILQARLDSTRLPGKSLLPLGGRPLILRVMEALSAVPCDTRVLASPEDCRRDFEPLAREAGFEFFAGSKDDVLGRYCAALRAFNARPADYVIRATGDNPFVFADAAALLAREAREACADYAGYTGLPYGSGVEVVKAAALFRAEAEATLPAEREHVCPYLYTHPEIFKLYRPEALPEFYGPDIKVTVDTNEDFERATRLWAELGPGPSGGKEIIAAYKRLFP